MRTCIALLLALLAVPLMDTASEAARGIRDRSHGIRLTVRPRRGNQVVIRWRVSRKVVQRGATEYAFQYWTPRGWASFLYTEERSQGRIPVVAQLPGDGGPFCFRMIATGDEEDEDGEGSILGSGTSGNTGPCV